VAGDRNTALGVLAGSGVTGATTSTFIGAGSRAAQGDLTNATAIGADAVVSWSNSIQLGAPGTTVYFGAGGGVHGDLWVEGCVVGLQGVYGGVCQSDARLKTNVRPFDAVLERLARLQPVTFNWTTPGAPPVRFGTGTYSGLIAQEVEQVFPDMVSTDGQGFKRVNYGELPYLTLQAVKELKAENDALKADSASKADRIEALTAQLAALAARLERLESGLPTRPLAPPAATIERRERRR